MDTKLFKLNSLNSQIFDAVTLKTLTDNKVFLKSTWEKWKYNLNSRNYKIIGSYKMFSINLTFWNLTKYSPLNAVLINLCHYSLRQNAFSKVSSFSLPTLSKKCPTFETYSMSDVMSFCSFAAFVRAIQRKRVNQTVNRKINDKSFFSSHLSSPHFTCIFLLVFLLIFLW